MGPLAAGTALECWLLVFVTHHLLINPLPYRLGAWGQRVSSGVFRKGARPSEQHQTGLFCSSDPTTQAAPFDCSQCSSVSERPAYPELSGSSVNRVSRLTHDGHMTHVLVTLHCRRPLHMSCSGQQRHNATADRTSGPGIHQNEPREAAHITHCRQWADLFSRQWRRQNSTQFTGPAHNHPPPLSPGT